MRLVIDYSRGVCHVVGCPLILVRLIQYFDSRAIIMKHIVEREFRSILRCYEGEFRSFLIPFRNKTQGQPCSRGIHHYPNR